MSTWLIKWQRTWKKIPAVAICALAWNGKKRRWRLKTTVFFCFPIFSNSHVATANILFFFSWQTFDLCLTPLFIIIRFRILLLSEFSLNILCPNLDDIWPRPKWGKTSPFANMKDEKRDNCVPTIQFHRVKRNFLYFLYFLNVIQKPFLIFQMVFFAFHFDSICLIFFPLFWFGLITICTQANEKGKAWIYVFLPFFQLKQQSVFYFITLLPF